MVDLNAYKELRDKRRNQILRRTRIICFLALVVIHILDMATTVYGMSLGAYEMNPVARALFTLGPGGYVLSSIYVLIVFLLIFYFIKFLSLLYRLMTYKRLPLSHYVSYYLVFTAITFLGIASAVLNNILVIINLLG